MSPNNIDLDLERLFCLKQDFCFGFSSFSLSQNLKRSAVLQRPCQAKSVIFLLVLVQILLKHLLKLKKTKHILQETCLEIKAVAFPNRKCCLQIPSRCLLKNPRRFTHVYVVSLHKHVTLDFILLT